MGKGEPAFSPFSAMFSFLLKSDSNFLVTFIFLSAMVGAYGPRSIITLTTSTIYSLWFEGYLPLTFFFVELPVSVNVQVGILSHSQWQLWFLTGELNLFSQSIVLKIKYMYVSSLQFILQKYDIQLE